MFLLPEEPKGGAEEEGAGAGAHTGGGPGQLEIPWTALKYVTGEVRVTRKKGGGCGCQPRCTGMLSPWHVCEIESPRLHPPGLLRCASWNSCHPPTDQLWWSCDG